MSGWLMIHSTLSRPGRGVTRSRPRSTSSTSSWSRESRCAGVAAVDGHVLAASFEGVGQRPGEVGVAPPVAALGGGRGDVDGPPQPRGRLADALDGPQDELGHQDRRRAPVVGVGADHPAALVGHLEPGSAELRAGVVGGGSGSGEHGRAQRRHRADQRLGVRVGGAGGDHRVGHEHRSAEARPAAPAGRGRSRRGPSGSASRDRAARRAVSVRSATRGEAGAATAHWPIRTASLVGRPARNSSGCGLSLVKRAPALSTTPSRSTTSGCATPTPGSRSTPASCSAIGWRGGIASGRTSTTVLPAASDDADVGGDRHRDRRGDRDEAGARDDRGDRGGQDVVRPAHAGRRRAPAPSPRAAPSRATPPCGGAPAPAA